MAPNALEDLNMAVLLFQKASGQSQRAKIALVRSMPWLRGGPRVDLHLYGAQVVLKRLQDKALKIFNANSHGHPLEPLQMSDDVSFWCTSELKLVADLRSVRDLCRHRPGHIWRANQGFEQEVQVTAGSCILPHPRQ